MSEQDNVQTLQSLYAAFGRGDIQMILDHLSDDVTWGTETSATEVPWYSIRSGRAGVADFFSTLDREVEFTKFDPTLFAGTGDEVVALVEIGYRMKKNGRMATVGSMHRFSIVDGTVRSFRAFEDTASVQSAWNA